MHRLSLREMISALRPNSQKNINGIVVCIIFGAWIQKMQMIFLREFGFIKQKCNTVIV